MHALSDKKIYKNASFIEIFEFLVNFQGFQFNNRTKINTKLPLKSNKRIFTFKEIDTIIILKYKTLCYFNY